MRQCVIVQPCPEELAELDSLHRRPYSGSCELLTQDEGILIELRIFSRVWSTGKCLSSEGGGKGVWSMSSKGGGEGVWSMSSKGGGEGVWSMTGGNGVRLMTGGDGVWLMTGGDGVWLMTGGDGGNSDDGVWLITGGNGGEGVQLTIGGKGGGTVWSRFRAYNHT